MLSQLEGYLIPPYRIYTYGMTPRHPASGRLIQSDSHGWSRAPTN